MRLIDLHCDTLYRAYREKRGLLKNDFHISLEKSGFLNTYIQCMAVWIPDEYRKVDAENLFNGCVQTLEEQLENSGVMLIKCGSDLETLGCGCGLILTVEGGAVLAGKLDNVRRLYGCGVRMMTLTWNGENELGDGIGVSNAKGLTKFGRTAVSIMESEGIIIDLSHASEPLFYDTAQLAKRPVCVSHSNLRKTCPHMRNLTDEQFRFIRDSGGLVGINFCRDFLSNNGTNVSMYDIIRAADDFLSLGGEKTIAFGSDFDGCKIPKDMKGIESMGELYNMFLRHGYREALLDDLFYSNAFNFFKKMI